MARKAKITLAGEPLATTPQAEPAEDPKNLGGTPQKIGEQIIENNIEHTRAFEIEERNESVHLTEMGTTKAVLVPVENTDGQSRKVRSLHRAALAGAEIVKIADQMKRDVYIHVGDSDLYSAIEEMVESTLRLSQSLKDLLDEHTA